MLKTILFILFLIPLPASGQQRFADLRRQGDSLMHARRYGEAIQAYEQAEGIGARKIFMTQLYTDMARCYDATGRYSDEMRCYEQLATLVPDPDLMKVKMAEMQLRTGQFQEVVFHLQQMTTDARYDNQRQLMLASALHHLGENEASTAILDSIILSRKGMRDESYRAAINNKAFMLSSLGDHKQAIPLLQEAMNLYPPNDPMRAAVLGNLALAEAHTGEKTSLEHIGQAIKTIETTLGTDSHDYIILLRKKAEILLLTGQDHMALQAFKDFFNHEKQYVTANFAFMSDQQRRNYWKREQPLIAECYAMESLDPDFLLDVAVFSKAILYQHNIDQRQSEDFGKTFQADGQAVRTALKPGECAVEFVTYQKDNEEHYGAIVAYNNRPTRFVSLFARDSLLCHQIKGKTGTKPLSYCIAHTDRPMKNALYADTTLCNMIWGKIADTTTSRLFFAPDADLHILAAEYLPSATPMPTLYRLSSTYTLTKRHHVTRQGSGAMVIGGVDYAAKDIPFVQGFLPDRSGSRQMSLDHMLPSESTGFKYLKGSGREADTIAAMLTTAGTLCLKGSAATEQQTKSLLPGHSILHISTHGFCSDILEPDKEEADKDSLSEDKSLVRSGIILAGANKYAQQHPENKGYEDGILTAREISQMDLTSVDMTVLSACQTALGRASQNGMAAMPQGLKKAGVRTIVASLWHVDDEATTRLMTAYYRHLDDNDKPCPQEAMHRAQTELRQASVTTTAERFTFNPATLGRRKVTTTKHTSFNEPFFWAPFIVIDGI